MYVRYTYVKRTARSFRNVFRQIAAKIDPIREYNWGKKVKWFCYEMCFYFIALELPYLSFDFVSSDFRLRSWDRRLRVLFEILREKIVEPS